MAEDRQKPLYLEDLQIGQKFVSGEHVLNEAQIKSFADQFDPQPFHQDTESARTTMFGGLIASGWHTAAITMRLLVESVPVAGGLIGAGGEAVWPRPARPQDVLHVESEIVAITPSQSRPDRGIVTLRAETLNQNCEAVQILTAKLVAFHRPANNDIAP